MFRLPECADKKLIFMCDDIQLIQLKDGGVNGVTLQSYSSTGPFGVMDSIWHWHMNLHIVALSLLDV